MRWLFAPVFGCAPGNSSGSTRRWVLGVLCADRVRCTLQYDATRRSLGEREHVTQRLFVDPPPPCSPFLLPPRRSLVCLWTHPLPQTLPRLSRKTVRRDLSRSMLQIPWSGSELRSGAWGGWVCLEDAKWDLLRGGRPGRALCQVFKCVRESLGSPVSGVCMMKYLMRRKTCLVLRLHRHQRTCLESIDTCVVVKVRRS